LGWNIINNQKEYFDITINDLAKYCFCMVVHSENKINIYLGVSKWNYFQHSRNLKISLSRRQRLFCQTKPGRLPLFRHFPASFHPAHAPRTAAAGIPTVKDTVKTFDLICNRFE
jgi:hypothetical protein